MRKGLCLLLCLSLPNSQSAQSAQSARPAYEGIVAVVPTAAGKALKNPVLHVRIVNLTRHRIVLASSHAGAGIAMFRVQRRPIEPGAEEALADVRFESERMSALLVHHTTSQHAIEDAEKAPDGAYVLRPESNFRIRLELVESQGRSIPVDLVAAPQKYFGYRLAQYIASASLGGLATIFGFIRFYAAVERQAQLELLRNVDFGGYPELEAGAQAPSSLKAKAERVGRLYRAAAYENIAAQLPAPYKAELIQRLRDMEIERGVQLAEARLRRPLSHDEVLGIQATVRGAPASAMFEPGSLTSYAGRHPRALDMALESVLQKRLPGVAPKQAALTGELFEQFVRQRDGQESRAFLSALRRGRFSAFAKGVGGGLFVAAMVYGLFELGAAIKAVHDRKDDRMRVPEANNQTINLQLEAPTGPRADPEGFAELHSAMADTRVVREGGHVYLVALLAGDSKYLDFYSGERPAGAPADEMPEAAGTVTLYFAPLPSAAESCRDLKVSSEHGYAVMRGRCLDAGGNYRESSLILNACMPLTDFRNEQGKLACDELAPPGNYRKYFEFAQLDGRRADTYHYDAGTGVLTVSAPLGDTSRRDVATLDYRRDCAEGSEVMYDPLLARLYCSRLRVPISGSVVHYCKGHAMDGPNQVVLSGCQRDDGPVMSLRYDLSACPDPQHMVLNLLPLQPVAARSPGAPRLTRGAPPAARYGLECVDLSRPQRRIDGAQGVPANPFDRAVKPARSVLQPPRGIGLASGSASVGHGGLRAPRPGEAQ